MKTLEQIIKKSSWYYVNNNITSANFPKPDNIETEGWKLIKMSQSFSSQEALDEIKRQGCRPANVWELAEWANTHRENEMPEDTWNVVLALGSSLFVGGYRGVPGVHRSSDGDFKFDLDYFEFGWNDDYVRLAFCDPILDTQKLEKSSVSLSLESAIEMIKKEGYVIYKPI